MAKNDRRERLNAGKEKKNREHERLWGKDQPKANGESIDNGRKLIGKPREARHVSRKHISRNWGKGKGFSPRGGSLGGCVGYGENANGVHAPVRKEDCSWGPRKKTVLAGTE